MNKQDYMQVANELEAMCDELGKESRDAKAEGNLPLAVEKMTAANALMTASFRFMKKAEKAHDQY